MTFEVLVIITLVVGLMFVASVALETCRDHEVGRGRTTTGS